MSEEKSENELFVMDLKNYDTSMPHYLREAVRAIIFNNGKIALVKSEKEGYFKFPGGGIENGETHQQTLIRETQEETGLNVIPYSIEEYGMVKELRKSLFAEEIFEQISYYYFCEIEEDKISQNCLDEYETELGYHLEYVNIEEAIKTNSMLENNYESEFIKRETNILRLLLNEKISI